MTLAELFNQYKTDKESSHNYSFQYEELFGPIRHDVTTVLEVGVQWGGSLRAWRDYFPNAMVTGLDISSTLWQEDRIRCHKCDSRDAEEVDKVLRGMTFDIIIDDGDHHPDAQHATRENLWSYLKPGGIYVVEDVQWTESWGGFIADGADIVDCRKCSRPVSPDSVLAVFHKGSS